MALPEKARVLITVKASPEPSTSYGDTVCVAGIRLDSEKPEWIRLFPVPFRYLGEDQQFTKYEIVTLQLTKARNDPRPESYSPNLESITRGSVLPVAARPNHILPLVNRTMCEVVEDIGEDLNGTSLAVVRAREITGMKFKTHGPWKPEEEKRLATWAEAPDLFGTPRARVLQPPRLKVYYTWFCESPNCHEHEQRLLDWELTAFQRRWRNDSEEAVKDAIRQRFLTDMFPANKVPHFYVGNFAAGPKRKTFSLLGLFPSAKANPDAVLF